LAVVNNCCLIYICQICYLLVDKDDVYYSVYFIDSRFVAVAGGLMLLMVLHRPTWWHNKTVQNLHINTQCRYSS